ncbi:MAG: DUF1553 domain-containing protein, partial [Verrucomicrobiota bacterium]
QALGEQENLKSTTVARGELIQFTIQPKADHVCDTTLLDFQLTELGGEKRIWNLTNEVALDFLNQNPRADTFGNAGVWHFIDLANMPKSFGETNSPLPRLASLLREKSADTTELQAAALEIQQSLESGSSAGLKEDLLTARGAFWFPIRSNEKLFSSETTKSLATLKMELAGLKNTPPPPVLFAHGLQDGGVPESSMAGFHDVKIHVRGRYDRLGDLEPRRFPRILAGDEQKPITEGSGRLQLADWIASADNPLTARVMVNRIWQHHFGEGIVRTPNNYGKLGTPPTHPALLDFLAQEFVKSGWSIKAMHRAMMLSATYQQSSENPATVKTDADNKFFSRMNRQRLESEVLRDSLLSVAGNLNSAFGGPSLRDFSTNRRTLYITTIRSDRATYQFLFDAADPNAIVDKRIDSTVSPQALFLMNHPFALAQTKALSGRVAQLENAGDEKKLQWLYETLYAREPSSQEIKIGFEALTKARAGQRENSDELAWEQYCQVLLCANEFIYVD